MRQFQFPLERVLWHRGCQEELAQQALARALQGEQALLEELAQVHARAVEAAAELHATLARPTAGDEMLLHTRFAASLAGREAGLAGRRAEIALLVQERRMELQARWRSREAVARLRARALARYRQAADREMQLAMDETTGVRYARRLASSAGRPGSSRQTAPAPEAQPTGQPPSRSITCP